MSPAATLDLYWRAYILGTHPLENGDKLMRPRWDWFLMRLSMMPEIPNQIPSGAVRYKPPRF